MLSHENFIAYQHALEFAEISINVADEIPEGSPSLKNQLRVATFSMLVNLAKGSGKRARVERKSAYSAARCLAFECAAVCDIIAMIEPKERPKIVEAKLSLEAVIGILTELCFGRSDSNNASDQVAERSQSDYRPSCRRAS